MPLRFFKVFEKDSLADGGTWSDDWTITEDLVLKRIYIQDKSGSDWTDSTFYFKIDEDVYTHSIVPAKVLGQQKDKTPVLDIPVKKGQLLSFTFKNQEGATKSLFLTFEFWKV